MSNEAVIAQVLIEYGDALRGDWSNFDGRSAKSVLHDLAAELLGTRESRTVEQHRAMLGLCPDGGGHWGGRWGHCDTYECPTYAKELEADGATE